MLENGFSNPTEFHENLASINCAIYDNFYHWMLETFPKFGLLEHSGIKVQKYLVSSSFDFQKDCLSILNIDLTSTVCPKTNELMMVEDLVAPSAVGPIGVPTEFAVGYLREKFSNYLSTGTPSRRIYITRAGALARRVVNEAALVTALALFGFEVVRLSELPLTEQARTFSEAEIVIGPHGAGMTHVVFQQPQSRGMIEFMPETYSHECFRMICDITGTPYRRIVSRTRDPAVHDIEVDVARMIDSVREALNLQP